MALASIELSVTSSDAAVSSIEANVRSIEAHVPSNEAHAPSNEEHARSNEARVRSNEAHVRSNEEHARSNEEHVPSNEGHARSIERHVRSIEERAPSIEGFFAPAEARRAHEPEEIWDERLASPIDHYPTAPARGAVRRVLTFLRTRTIGIASAHVLPSEHSASGRLDVLRRQSIPRRGAAPRSNSAPSALLTSRPQYDLFGWNHRASAAPSAVGGVRIEPLTLADESSACPHRSFHVAVTAIQFSGQSDAVINDGEH